MQLMWSQKHVDCSPEPFQLQAVTVRADSMPLAAGGTASASNWGAVPPPSDVGPILADWLYATEISTLACYP